MEIFFNKCSVVYNDLNSRYRDIIKYMFKSVKEASTINVEKYGDNRGVFRISRGKESKIIMYRESYNISVRNHTIKEFSEYLSFIEVSKEIITAIKRYHYADGTTTGDNPGNEVLRKELKTQYNKEIEMVNNYFTKNKSKTLRIFRYLFIHNGSDYLDTQFFIINMPEGALVIDAKEMLQTLFEEEYYCEYMHIGPINYNSAHRNSLKYGFTKYYRSLCAFSFNFEHYLNKKD